MNNNENGSYDFLEELQKLINKQHSEAYDTIVKYIASGIVVEDWKEESIGENKTNSILYVSVPEKSEFTLAGKELAIAFKDLMNFLRSKGGGQSEEWEKYYGGKIQNIKVLYKIRPVTWTKSLYEKRKFFYENIDDLETFMPELKNFGFGSRTIYI